MPKRQIVLQWWSALTPYEREIYWDEYRRAHFTPAVHVRLLTGREIEIIYDKKNQGDTEIVNEVLTR